MGEVVILVGGAEGGLQFVVVGSMSILETESIFGFDGGRYRH